MSLPLSRPLLPLTITIAYLESFSSARTFGALDRTIAVGSFPRLDLIDEAFIMNLMITSTIYH